MEEYQSFRRRTMNELTREFPDISYRQKMKIVGERWRQTKITQLVRMNNKELLEDPIDEQYTKRLKYTIIDVGPEDFLDIEIPETDHENLLLTVISRVFRNSPINSPLIPLFRKFLCIKDFYGKKIHGLDIFDLCCLHFRHDFMYHILDCMPPRWRQEFILEQRERLPCVLNVFLYNIFEEEDKAETLEILRQLLTNGLDPNIELLSPLTDSLPPYEDSLVKTLREQGMGVGDVRKLVRYVGVSGGEEYRQRLRESDYVRKLEVLVLEETRSKKLVGDTAFSVLLQNSRSQRYRSFISGILRSGVVYTNTILYPYKYFDLEGVKTYLSISLLTGSLKHMDELSSLLFENTPAYMFYISDFSQTHPTGNASPMSMALKNIKTCWNGFLRTSPDCAPVLTKILTGGFCIPREEFFWKIHMQPEFSGYVREEIVKNYFQQRSKPVFENLLQTCENRDIDPLKTCLASLVLYPPVLKRILEQDVGSESEKEFRPFSEEGGLGVMKNQSFIFRQFHAYRKEVLGQISGLCLPNNPGVDYVNETFLLDEEPVRDSGKLIFRTEDNYAFEPIDWPFLLRKKINPYTRRELTEGEKNRLRTLREVVNRTWVVLSREEIPYADFLEGEIRDLRDNYVEKIDEFLDSIDMVNYGTRLRDQVWKLGDPDVLRRFYGFLFHNPGMCTFGPETDTTFSDWCISLSPSSIDPGDLEEIAVYYGFRIRSSQPSVVDVLGHIYNVLETTLEYGRKDRFIGRVLSVYYLIDNYLRPL